MEKTSSFIQNSWKHSKGVSFLKRGDKIKKSFNIEIRAESSKNVKSFPLYKQWLSYEGQTISLKNWKNFCIPNTSVESSWWKHKSSAKTINLVKVLKQLSWLPGTPAVALLLITALGKECFSCTVLIFWTFLPELYAFHEQTSCHLVSPESQL